MERKSSRIFLMYAGAIVLLFSLLSGLTLARPDAGFLSVLGSIIVNLFVLPFFLIGLVIGVALCIAVALGIFVLAAYLMDRDKGKELAVVTKQAALAQVMKILACIAPQKFGNVAPQCACKVAPCAEPADVVQTGSGSDQMMTVLSRVDDRLSAIDASMRDLKAEAVQFARTGQLDELRASVREMENCANKMIEEKVLSLREAVEKVAAQGGDVSALERKLDETVARIARFENDVAALADMPGKLASLRDELEGRMKDVPQQMAALKEELQKQLEAAQAKEKKTVADAPAATATQNAVPAGAKTAIPAPSKGINVKAQPKVKKKSSGK